RRASRRSSGDALTLFAAAASSARFVAYFLTSSRRFCSRSIMQVLAIRPSVSKREVERGQQCACFVVSFSRGGNRDVHAAECIDLVVFDLRENDLLTNTHVVVAATIERLRGEATEVANSRNGDGHQAIEEFVHALSTQRHLATQRITDTNLEAGNRLLGLGS